VKSIISLVNYGKSFKSLSLLPNSKAGETVVPSNAHSPPGNNLVPCQLPLRTTIID